MRRLTAVIISVVLSLIVLGLYLGPALIQRYQQQRKPPLEELVPQLKVEEDGRRYVIEEPLSWAEAYDLFFRGRVTYDYVFPYCRNDDLLSVLSSYLNYTLLRHPDPCGAVAERFSWLKVIDEPCASLLFRDGCYWAKKLVFGSEREWYATLVLVPPLVWRAASRYANHSIWVLIYFENRSMVVELYNAVDPAERRQLMQKYEQLVSRYPRVVVLMERGVRKFWYNDYKLLEETGTPYILVFEAAYNTAIRPPLDEHLKSYGVQLGFSSLDGALYVNGTLRAVYTISEVWCREAGVPCATTLSDLLNMG